MLQAGMVQMTVQPFDKDFFNVLKPHIADDLCHYIMVIGDLTLPADF